MARIKSPVLNSHSTPLSMIASASQDSQGEVVTPTRSAPRSTLSKRCPQCNKILNALSGSEFDDHVEKCSGPAVVAASVSAHPASGGSSPLSYLSRSPSPVSDLPLTLAPLEDLEEDSSVNEAGNEDSFDSDDENVVIETDFVYKSKGNENEFDNGGAVADKDRNVASVNLSTARRPFEAKMQDYPTIGAYVTTEVVEIVDGKVVKVLEPVMEEYDDGDEINLGALETENGEGEKAETESTPVPSEEKEDASPVENPEAGTDMDSDAHPAGLVNDKRTPTQLEDAVVTKENTLTVHPKASKKYPFKKLVSADEFVQYLANPEKLSFAELYYRTAQTAGVLKALQDEWDSLDIVTKEADVYQKAKAKEAKEAEKLVEENKLRDEEPDLIKVLEEYEEQLRQREKGWKLSLDEIHRSGIKESDPDKYTRLMRLRNDTKLRSDITEKMNRAQQASSDTPRNLTDVPLPKLTAEDYKNDKVKKRTYLESQIKWDDRKMMDVYGLPYSSAESRVGNQDLKDRNAVDENGVSLYENGRPKRSRAKRTIYDTEPSGPPSPETEEVLPAKRRRVQRNPEEADVVVGDETSRAQTPPMKVVATFSSGKRVGRPPNSTKSRLNEAHIPPILGQLANDEEGRAQSVHEKKPVKKQRGARAQKLDSTQESDLINSATALVEHTLSEHGPGDVSVKPKSIKLTKTKGRGGRPKKQHDIDADADVDADVNVLEVAKSGAKSRVSKTKRKPATKNLSSQYVEDDILQSTEQDDQSRFASASTSRPTTASSRLTRSTFGSRANSQLQEFAPSGEDTFEAATSGTAKRGRGNKRKLNISELVHDGDDGAEAVAASSKRRKVTTKKQSAAIAEELEDISDEAASPKVKRKRAATVADSIEVVRPEQVEDMVDAADAPTKKRPRAKVPKSRPMKVETESDFFEDEDETAAPRKKLKLPVKKGSSSRGNSTFGADFPDGTDEIELGESEEDGLDADSTTKRSRALAKKPRAKKESTRKPKSKAPADVTAFETNLKETDPEAYDALMQRKAQKSAKLSASAKARWASGLMRGPMEKRARTNAAKAAAKKSGGGSVGTTPGPSAAPTVDGSEHASVPPQDFDQAPPQVPFSQGVFQAAAQPPPAQPSPTSVPPNTTATRNSKRPRKPTIKAPTSFGGLDGVGDEQPRSQMSTYDTFQALSSPGSPMVLGKRNRKQVFSTQADDDDDEDDDDYWGM